MGPPADDDARTMALKDRDYMRRWGRDDPYHNQLDLGPPNSKRLVASGVGERRSRLRFSPRRSSTLSVFVAVAVAAAVYAMPHWSAVKSSLGRVDRQMGSGSPHVQTPSLFADPHSVHLQWHAGLTSPAKEPTVWWINTPNGKRVQVTVAAGTTPLAALTKALASQGWRAVYP
jgi:hypothetical protein